MTLTVGVDVGGTKIAAGLVDEQGHVVADERRPTGAGTYAALLGSIVGTVEAVTQQIPSDGAPLGGVGLAIAGNVAADGSHVLFSPHLPLSSEPIRDDLQQQLGVAVTVDNDANAATWAECRSGAAAGAHDALMVTLGTGLGAGLVIAGELYRGSQGFAGEAGHITVVRDGRPCPCGSRGCWERYASGTALLAAYLEEGGNPEASGPDITAAAIAGDAIARSALIGVGEWLGHGLASLVAVLDPAIIVVGGGLSEAGELLLAPARRTFAATLTGRERRPAPSIVVARLGNDAGLIGAAMLAARHTP